MSSPEFKSQSFERVSRENAASIYHSLSNHRELPKNPNAVKPTVTFAQAFMSHPQGSSILQTYSNSLSASVNELPPIGHLHSMAHSSSNNVSLEKVKGGLTIFIARPLTELNHHVKDHKLPSFALIARCIKTLVASIFNWHLYDQLLIGDMDKDNVLSSLDGKVSVNRKSDIRKLYPYLFKSADLLELNQPSSTSEAYFNFNEHELTPDIARQYFLDVFKVKITPKERNNTIQDLFASNVLLFVE